MTTTANQKDITISWDEPDEKDQIVEEEKPEEPEDAEVEDAK